MFEVPGRNPFKIEAPRQWEGRVVPIRFRRTQYSMDSQPARFRKLRRSPAPPALLIRKPSITLTVGFTGAFPGPWCLI